jgi:hypothetical protein
MSCRNGGDFVIPRIGRQSRSGAITIDLLKELLYQW